MPAIATILHAAALCILATLAGCAHEPPWALEGRWRTLETTRGGVGAMIGFTRGGGFDHSTGAIVDMSYQREGDVLVETLRAPASAPAAPAIRETVVWMDPGHVRFRSSSADDPGEAFERAATRPQDPADPLFGEWIGSREMGGHRLTVLRIFRPSHRMLLLIPFVTEHGRYEVDGDRIRFELPRQPPLDGTFSFDGPTLIVTLFGKPSRYERY